MMSLKICCDSESSQKIIERCSCTEIVDEEMTKDMAEEGEVNKAERLCHKIPGGAIG